MTTPSVRARSLHAARAVTLAGFVSAGCGGVTRVHTTDPSATSTGDEQNPTLEVAPSDAPGAGTPDPGQTIIVWPDSILAPVDEPSSAAEQAETPVAACGKELDGICPAECTTENDADCCEGDQNSAGWMWCSYSTEWGCNCAIEGPFAPPSFRPIL